jgi:hypothetical protein
MPTIPDDTSGALTRLPVSFEGLASAGAALLRSPVSGQTCVYWRVRIVQRLTDRSQLVHEIASEEAFELALPRRDDGATTPRVRLEPELARINATPVLHREGTPGARAAGQFFGLAGPVSVEETLIRPGEALTAEGILDDLDDAAGAGAFRGTSRGPELVDAIVTLESKSLAPVLLPWALGTAAALMSGMGLATYAAWRAHLLTRSTVAAVAAVRLPRLNAQLLAPELPHPRLP